ncbi:hypothetical protein H4R21_000640 [Coemansia helicoidea]|uniref:Uncharacterized protein n=1 Tax=Coemansia helicoidea TaxID=1286919 RepID=A0ACC1LFJ8_9FUNG|nr:hypothetical protein H4R21_000640 [Coemansia helicoidea]
MSRNSQPRLASRASQSYGSTAAASTVDMDCLYMDVAAEVKRVMHAHGIHSATVQPEFAVGQSVSVATTRTATADSSALAAALEHAMHGPDGGADAREGSVLSRVEIVPSGHASPHRTGQATIGPCLLTCRGGRCMPSSCCPGEPPIQVVPGSRRGSGPDSGPSGSPSNHSDHQ